MSSIPKAVESRGRFLERIEGGAAETSVDERLVALTAPMSAAAEQYRMLLHRLRHIRSLRGEAIQGGAVVAVTSAIRGEGVSLTAANLALTAARSRDARVALVACDLRRGGLAQLFDMGGRAGLADAPPAWCSSRRRWWAWRSPSADTTRAAGASSPPWSGLRVACRRRSTSPTSMTRR